VFHPTLPLVYCDNERGSSVTAYAFDEKTGTLTPGRTVSTLPADFTGNNTCADIALTPDARFLYASNRGHDSLAGFMVDEKTGALTPIGQFATEKTPRSFSIDPAGRFVYAAGQGSGKLAAYRLDAKSGALERFDTYEVGKEPAWVQAAPGR
jgi:6-phosphogluconolactonase